MRSEYYAGMKYGLAVTTCMSAGLNLDERMRVFRRFVNSLMDSDFGGPILIVDDGSDVTDHLGLIDSRRALVVANRSRRGIAASKNIGLRLLYELGCNYLMLSDDDVEFFDPRFAEQYMHAHASSGVHMLCANFSRPRQRVQRGQCELDEVGDHNGHFMSLTRPLVEAMGYLKVLPHAYGGEHSEYQHRPLRYHRGLCDGCYDVVDSRRLLNHQVMPPSASHGALAIPAEITVNLQLAVCDSPHVPYADQY